MSEVPGIRVLPDIMTAPGVDTLEGRIGPLMHSARGRCHYIDFPAGLYTEEHEHPTESLIYTVRGRWVLSSQGQHWDMKAGSLFWFGDNVPTGYSTPFGEGAYFLIFKAGEMDSDDQFFEYLRGMAARLEEDHASGTPFYISEIPPDHPVLRFADSVRDS